MAAGRVEQGAGVTQLRVFLSCYQLNVELSFSDCNRQGNNARDIFYQIKDLRFFEKTLIDAKSWTIIDKFLMIQRSETYENGIVPG